ncbi:MAG: type II toxin-antitoxin system VapC family toxin [Blastocatellia bacterium]
MSYVVDTNVLARTVHKNHPMQPVAKAAINNLLDQGEILFVFPQSLYEFWVMATRPEDANGFGMSVAEATNKVADFEMLLAMKLDQPGIYAEWKQLVTQHAVIGKPAHDARIVAAMKVHGITHLLTFNVGDFKRFQAITVVSPNEVQ